jgi:hypothetical protein
MRSLLYGLWLLLAPAPPAPRLMLWAWERPEDLRFVDPTTTGVAWLAATFELRAGGVVEHPRRQPLQVPPGTWTVATVRLHPRGGRLTEADAPALAARILAYARRPGLRGLQIDFDAVTSERAAYRALLAALRAGLPAGLELTATGLASWCLDDAWIGDLPVDAVIPQFFRMGPEGPRIRGRIARGVAPPTPLCTRGVGVATDEPVARPWPVPTVWAFHPRTPWTAAAVRRLEEQLWPR